MSVQLIELGSPAFEKMLEENFKFLQKLFEKSNALNVKVDQNDWIDVKTAMKLLGVGRTKMQAMKNERQIDFTQFQKKLKFSRKSIDKFLKQHSTLKE